MNKFDNWIIKNKSDINNLYNIWYNQSVNYLNIHPKYFNSNILYIEFCKYLYKKSYKDF